MCLFKCNFTLKSSAFSYWRWIFFILLRMYSHFHPSIEVTKATNVEKSFPVRKIFIHKASHKGKGPAFI